MMTIILTMINPFLPEALESEEWDRAVACSIEVRKLQSFPCAFPV